MADKHDPPKPPETEADSHSKEQEISALRLPKADVGDYVAVKGKVFRSKTNELTLAAEAFTPLTKALRPLPEKWHGLVDVEQRYRQRYLDLVSNPGVKDTFLKRTRLVNFIRGFL